LGTACTRVLERRAIMRPAKPCDTRSMYNDRGHADRTRLSASGKVSKDQSTTMELRATKSVRLQNKKMRIKAKIPTGEKRARVLFCVPGGDNVASNETRSTI